MILSVIEDVQTDGGVCYGVDIADDKTSIEIDCASPREAEQFLLKLEALLHQFHVPVHKGMTIRKESGWTVSK